MKERMWKVKEVEQFRNSMRRMRMRGRDEIE